MEIKVVTTYAAPCFFYYRATYYHVTGIAGLCSEDGRHLALMPHPERSFLLWQVLVRIKYCSTIFMRQ